MIPLGRLCTIKTNFPDADFWLIRKGSEKEVGKPVKEFSAERIGVKVIATELIDPGYLFHWFAYLHVNHIFEQISTGTLRLRHIRTSDIAGLPMTFRE